MARRSVALSILIIAALAALVLLRSIAQPSQPQRPAGLEASPEASTRRYSTYTQEIMATPITVLLPAEHGEAAASIVFDIFKQVDARMSEWKPTSPLSTVNGAAGAEAVEVPDDLRAIIRRGREIGNLTDGAFDITWAALWGLWDFNAKTPTVPDDDEIARRAALVDYRRIDIDDDAGTVFLPIKGMMIGLGGIAKGHALDLAAAALRERDVDSFLITAGGQTLVCGMRGDRPWRIGVRDPRGPPDDYFAHLELTNVSVSTSGDYERYFIIESVRYHHILDTRTRRPARGLRSATVISADGTLADALSTSLMILGLDRALTLVETLDNVEAVIVDDRAQVHITSGLEGKIHDRHTPAK